MDPQTQRKTPVANRLPIFFSAPLLVLHHHPPYSSPQRVANISDTVAIESHVFLNLSTNALNSAVPVSESPFLPAQ